VFLVTVPLTYVRRIEKFAFTYVIADFLILITAITILVFAVLHIQEKGFDKWGEGVPAINEHTWLTMIGSSIYSFEGIGVVLPILEVTENPKQFPKLLLLVMLTNVVLFTGFGEFCLFVYGAKELEGKPLITMNLPDGPIIYTLKAVFSINVIISISLCAFPANNIIEGYVFRGMKDQKMKYWLINLQRTLIFALAIVLCIVLGTSLDKFNSVIGTVTATPVVFMIPCLAHYRLCNPTKVQKVIDIAVIIFAIVVLIYCTGFTLWTWNE
jgi:proton-coupled amino acid transporter